MEDGVGLMAYSGVPDRVLVCGVQNLERTRFGAVLARLPAWLGHFYTLAVVAIGWVLFRSDDLGTAWVHLSSIAGLAPGDGTRHYVAAYTDNRTLLCLAAAILQP